MIDMVLTGPTEIRNDMELENLKHRYDFKELVDSLDKQNRDFPSIETMIHQSLSRGHFLPRLIVGNSLFALLSIWSTTSLYLLVVWNITFFGLLLWKTSARRAWSLWERLVLWLPFQNGTLTMQWLLSYFLMSGQSPFRSFLLLAGFPSLFICGEIKIDRVWDEHRRREWNSPTSVVSKLGARTQPN